MTSFIDIPLQPILYAGLGGTLLALIVATAQNQWSPRVFFLLALRLAIGWHFLFEGLHKIHTHEVGPTETNRPFSSEIYFKVAPGPLGAQMRKQFDDPQAVIDAMVKPGREITPAAFTKLSAEEQAAACPEAVAKQLDDLAGQMKADEARVMNAIALAEKKGAGDAVAAERVKKLADAAREAVNKLAEAAPPGPEAKVVEAAKTAYARWVYGVDGRPTKVKFVTGDVALTAPERLAHLAVLQGDEQTAESRLKAGLGTGLGVDAKKATEVRGDLTTAEADLAKDAVAFVGELKKGLGGKTVADFADAVKQKISGEDGSPTFLDDMNSELVVRSRGQVLDRVTMWFLVVVGGSLMAGLFTRVMCVLGAGFLAMTYLAHPAFPWYPLPPNTEGNPVFINKNVIEALALLALASLPTGKWLGIDALISRCCSSGGPDAPTSPSA